MPPVYPTPVKDVLALSPTESSPTDFGFLSHREHPLLFSVVDGFSQKNIDCFFLILERR